MRLDQGWSDVCIRNVSASGMMLQAGSPPPRGTYVEISRATLTVVARVVWSSGHRFGVKAQSPLNIADIIGQRDKSQIDYQNVIRSKPTFERHMKQRVTQAELRQSAERNRLIARVAEFAAVGIAVAAGALLLGDAVFGSLIAPVERASAALEQSGGKG